MKKITLASVIMITAYLFSCSALKTPEYQPPENEPDKYKSLLIARFEEGKILYKDRCTNCHDKKILNKDGTAKFTLEQIETYNIRISNDNHSEKIGARDLSEDDLSKIQFYIRALINE